MTKTRIRSSEYVGSQMYHIVKDIASLITAASGNGRFPIEPHLGNACFRRDSAIYH